MRTFVHRLLAAALIAAFPLTVHAHTLSIQVNKTTAEPGGKLTTYLAWGHALPVDELVDGDSITAYQVMDPSGSVTPLKAEGRSLQANELTLEQEGLYQIAIERKPSVFTMVKGADGKNTFLRVGKDEVKLKAGESIELSSRSRMFAKALVSVGAASGAAPAKLGHDLEIVPMDGPSSFVLDRPIRFQVLFQGKPVAKAEVYATNVAGSSDGSSSATLTTDSEGVAIFTPELAGAWVLSAGHEVPSAGDDSRRFNNESYGACLTFGVVDDAEVAE